MGCSVLGTEDMFLSEPDEVELPYGFFDFKEKYSLKNAKIIVPARVSAEDRKRIRNTAQTIYRTLGCRGFARVDMFFTPQGKIIFNEVNTIPGFTAHSRFPKMLMASGLTFDEIVAKVIEEAMTR